MAKIKPFKGILYDSRIGGDLSKLVAPPYDVISEKMQEEYYRLHHNNVVRLILGKIKPSDNKSNNRYARAKRFLEDWIKKGILVWDKRPSLYIYSQSYYFRNHLKNRLGFISLMRIEDPHKSRVLPHEYTFTKPKKDRLELLKTTRANLSPIFSLFEDKGSSIVNILKRETTKRPIIDVEQEGVIHKVWRLTESKTIEAIKDAMKKKQIFIADGHHRYEVALNFRNWMRKKVKKDGREKDYDYIMVYFSNLNPEALTILSTHRVIKSVKKLNFQKVISKLKRYFSIDKFADKDGMLFRLEKAKKDEFVFGMYYKNKGFFSLTLKDKEGLDSIITQDRPYRWKRLDATILHQLIFDHVLKAKEKVARRDNIVYTREINYAIRLVDEEDYQMAFFLNPPRIEQVKDAARSHERMPRKTTYFYPKPLSGLVFYKMEDV